MTPFLTGFGRRCSLTGHLTAKILGLSATYRYGIVWYTINHLIFSQLCQSFTAQLFSKQVAWLGLWLEVFDVTKISPQSTNTWSFSPSGIVVGVDVVTGVRGVIKAGDLTRSCIYQ